MELESRRKHHFCATHRIDRRAHCEKSLILRSPTMGTKYDQCYLAQFFGIPVSIGKSRKGCYPGWDWNGSSEKVVEHNVQERKLIAHAVILSRKVGSLGVVCKARMVKTVAKCLCVAAFHKFTSLTCTVPNFSEQSTMRPRVRDLCTGASSFVSCLDSLAALQVCWGILLDKNLGSKQWETSRWTWQFYTLR